MAALRQWTAPWAIFGPTCARSCIQAEAISALVRELALQAQLLAQDAQGWHLQVQRSSLTQEQTVQRLAAALAQAFACPGVQVQVGRWQDSPPCATRPRPKPVSAVLRPS